MFRKLLVFPLVLVFIFLQGCASKKMKKSDWGPNTGVITYHQYKDISKEDFEKDLKKYINCSQAHENTNDHSYDNTVGEGKYEYACLTYDQACKNEDSASCFMKGLEFLNKNREVARAFFYKSCEYRHQKGCYFSGFLTTDQRNKQTFFEAACTLGHTQACKEVDAIQTPVTANEQLAFLENYSGQENVRTTASGLAYRIIKRGSGDRPKFDSKVRVKYEGRLIDGTVFDSSYARENTSIEFPLNGVIRGWGEGLQLIQEGGEIELVIPANLAYGSRGVPGSIPPGSTLIFKVELERVL